MPSRRRRGSGWLARRGLIVAEAILLAGLVKDEVFRLVKASDVPDEGKVLIAMLATLGLFGGLLLVVQQLLVRAVQGTLGPARSLAGWALHAALLLGIFLLYARMLGLEVLRAGAAG